LLIDDYPDALAALHEFLTVSGYEVECAESGRDGLTRFLAGGRDGSPDVVVLDLALPDIDGSDVVRPIPRASPSVFIIVPSGYQRVDVPAREAGADAFVLKPDIEALQGALERADAPARARKSIPDA